MSLIASVASEIANDAVTSSSAKLMVGGGMTAASGISLMMGYFDASAARVAVCLGIAVSVTILYKTVLEIKREALEIKMLQREVQEDS